jgi:small subunit ribosomal protein S8
MDPIANMIISIKNAGDAGRDSLAVPYSKIKEAIATVLKSEGFIKDFSIETRRALGNKVGRKELNISLFINKRTPKIRGVKRLSKNSKRIYKKSSEIRPVKNGYGLLVMTTPEGVMSGRDAKRASLGGEVLFSIW